MLCRYLQSLRWQTWAALPACQTQKYIKEAEQRIVRGAGAIQ